MCGDGRTHNQQSSSPFHRHVWETLTELGVYKVVIVVYTSDLGGQKFHETLAPMSEPCIYPSILSPDGELLPVALRA